MPNIQALNTDPDTLARLSQRCVDLHGAAAVDLTFTDQKLWVNVNSMCVLRIANIQQLKVTPPVMTREEALELSNMPAVFEAMQAFSMDPTEENGIQAILALSGACRE
jgi:hypothetical protein